MKCRHGWSWVAGLLVVVCLLFPAPASATLVGDTVNCSTISSFLTCSPSSATVSDPGVEFILLEVSDLQLRADILPSAIRLDWDAPVETLTIVDAHLLDLTSLDWTDFPSGEITGFLFSSSGVTGLDASDVSFTAHSVTIELGDTTWNPQSFALISLETTHTAVPEPGSLLLLGAGLAGLAGLGWRRGRRR